MKPSLPVRPRTSWRAFWPIVLAAVAVTCDAPTSISRTARLAIVPEYASFHLGRFSGLVIDSLHITVVRPPSTVVATAGYRFTGDTARAEIEVELAASSEDLQVTLVMLAGGQPVFTSTTMVTVTAASATGGTQPVAFPIVYVGPGANLAQLMIAPRDSGVSLGGSVAFTVAALDSQQAAVPQFYVSWSTSSLLHTITSDGVFRAGNARGSAIVRARSPNGVTDSTTVFVVPSPTAVAAFAGSGQSGAPGTSLPLPLVARVTANDGLGVAGVAVTFAPGTGGGSVDTAQAVTDSLGFAATTAVLGPAAGSHTFTASVQGLNAAVFSATAVVATQPTIALALPDTLAGIALTQQLNVTLSAAAPAGGLVVNVVSDSVAYLTVGAAGTINFLAGETLRQIGVTGVATGVARLRATAAGHTPDTLYVPVIPPFLSVTPPSANVSVGNNAPLTVSPRPRPVAPLAVTLSSSDSAVALMTPGTLNFAAAQSSQNTSVQGLAAGVAAITATAPGYIQGASVVTVGTGGVPTTLQKQAGDAQTAFIGDSTAIRPAVLVLDAGGAPVAGIQVQFTVTGGGGAVTQPLATTNVSGIATLASVWTLGATPGANALTATLPAFPGVTGVIFSATGQLPPPVIVMSVFGSTVVGQARSGTLNVRLLQAAPAGGVTASVFSTRSGFLYVGAYGVEAGGVAFLQGDTLKTLALFGDSTTTGVDTLIATAPGYATDTLVVPVSINLISLPGTLNVPLSQNVSLPINLSVAAPAGGIVVDVVSSNPAAVTVLTPTVTVPQGSQVANATVQGAGFGTATLTATNPNYAPDNANATVTANLNIIQTSIAPNTSFGVAITVQLESGGVPIAAPAGGVPVTMISRDSACFNAPNGVIPAGLINTSILVTYGGTATPPCSARLVATGPAGFATDSVLVNMQPQPVAAVSPTYLGAGLQRGMGGSLGAGNHGGTTVRVTSTNPALFLISVTDTGVGGAFADLPMPVNNTGFTFYVQALEGTIHDSADVIASAPGFVPDTARLVITQPVFDIIFLTGSGNTRSVNDAFQVRTGSASTPTGSISVEDVIRAGGSPLLATIVNDSVAVANLVTSALTADTVTAQIQPEQSRSPGTVATGGVELDYTAAGVTNVRATAPGYRPVAGALGLPVTVTAPVVTVGGTYIGAHLQRAVSGFLSAAAVAGDTVTLRTTQPGILKISANDSTGFADSIQIALGAGFTSFTWYIQGVDSITADTVDVIATLPQFTPDTAQFQVYAPVFDLIFLSGAGNTRTANDPFQARIGSAASPTGSISVEDELRFGHAPVTFSVINDSAAVGELITTALTGDSVTVAITARQSRSPSTVATGGMELDYTAGGVTNVRAHSGAGFRPVLAALGQAVTVSAPVISLGGAVIGARLQRAASGSLSAAAIAGDTVTLRTTQPGIIRISPNDSAGFGDSIQIAMGVGQSSFTYYFQGVDSIVADTVDVIATMPSFTPDSGTFRVYLPVYDIIFLSGSANALAVNDPFQVRIGTANSNTSGITVEDELRFGHPAVTATVATSAATVAQLVTTGTTGSAVTVTIAPRQSRTPSTVATGGVELDYLTTGTTVVTADLPAFRTLASDTQTVTVTAPFATVGNVTVGAGLQNNSSGSLSSGNHGGINVVVKSSNPGVALVSPNVSTPGTDSIIIAVAPGGTSFSYYVQGVERPLGPSQQVTISATAPGFTDGSATATVVDPAIDVIFLAGSGSVASTADDVFQVRLGYANAPANSGMSVEQELRAGGPGTMTVTIQLTDSTAALLKTTAVPAGAGTVTVQIQPGQARSPGTLATGGVTFDFVAPGVTHVVPIVPNVVTVKQSAPNTVPGFQVVVNP